MANSLKEILKMTLKQPAINLYWKIYGKTLRNPPLPINPKSILFICKGNICRSAFAEYAAPRLLKGSSWQGSHIASAGLIVPISEKSPPEAVSAAKWLGIDMNSHKSQSLTSELVKGYDIIFAMEAWQLRQMKKIFPQYLEKFFLLSLFDPERPPDKKPIFRYNIEDPYGKSADCYRDSFRRIERCIESLVSPTGANHRPQA